MLLSAAGAGSRSRSRLDRLHNTENYNFQIFVRPNGRQIGLRRQALARRVRLRPAPWRCLRTTHEYNVRNIFYCKNLPKLISNRFARCGMNWRENWRRSGSRLDNQITFTVTNHGEKKLISKFNYFEPVFRNPPPPLLSPLKKIGGSGSLHFGGGISSSSGSY